MAKWVVTGRIAKYWYEACEECVRDDAGKAVSCPKASQNPLIHLKWGWFPIKVKNFRRTPQRIAF